MKKDHSLTYIDLHPQNLSSQNSSTQSTIGDKILWIIIWILIAIIFGMLGWISIQLNLFA